MSRPMEGRTSGSFGRCAAARGSLGWGRDQQRAQVSARRATGCRGAPVRVWRDWALVAVLVLTAVLEGILRTDLSWRPVALVLAVALVFPLLWRRTHPLAVVVVALRRTHRAESRHAARRSGHVRRAVHDAVRLLAPYALLRWGSGREVIIGLPIIVVAGVLGIASDFTGFGEAAAGFVFLMFPAVLGALVRFWTTSRTREIDQVQVA